MFTYLSPEAEYEIRHEDYTMEMPQSGERIRGRVSTVVAVFELRDGKIWRDTSYHAEPFDVPEWRAHLVERMEP